LIKINQGKKEKFDKDFDLIKNEILNITLQWKIYKQIYGNKKNVDLTNEFSPMFFGLYQKISYDWVIISITRLLDPSKIQGYNNLSLKRLLEKNKNKKDLYEEISKIYDELKEKSKKLEIHRNKRIGHNDLNKARANYEKLPVITRNLIDKVLRDIYDFMNEISLYYYDYKECYGKLIFEKDFNLIKNLKMLKKVSDDW